jgi:hypothetical protein
MNVADSTVVPHDDPLLADDRHKALRVFWYLILAVTVYLLVERGWFSFYDHTPDNWGRAVIPIYIFSLCVLFLAEGVSHSAAQLHKADREGVLNQVQNDTSRLQKGKARLVEFLNSLFANFESFVIGRQIISLSAVALLAIAIENSAEIKQDFLGHLLAQSLRAMANFVFPPVSADVSKVVIETARWLEHFLSGFVAAFLLSALFPCWFSQILPSLLTTTASLRFFDLWGARVCVRASIYIGRAGTGLPGQVAARWIRRWPVLGFDKVERIGSGDTSTFEHLRSILGECISSRKIQLEISAAYLLVTDEITLELIGKPTSSVAQTLRVAMTHCDPSEISIDNNVEVTYPKGITGGERKQKAAVITLTDSTDAARLTQELLILAETRLETEIPRPTFESEQIRFTFRYMTPHLSLEPDKRDVFFFEISKPTRSVEISLHFEAGLFCENPKIRAGNIEEVIFRNIEDEDEVPFVPQMLDAHGRILSKEYPKAGRYGLFLNVLRQKSLAHNPHP